MHASYGICILLVTFLTSSLASDVFDDYTFDELRQLNGGKSPKFRKSASSMHNRNSNDAGKLRVHRSYTEMQNQNNQIEQVLWELPTDKANRWHEHESLGQKPHSRQGHTSTAIDNYLFVFGGCYLDKICYNDIKVYDVEMSRWINLVTRGNEPFSRMGHSAVRLGMQIMYFGGTSIDGIQNDVVLLDLTQPVSRGEEMHGRWGYPDIQLDHRSLKEPVSPRESHTATIIKDKMVVIGGVTKNGKVLTMNEVLVLDLKSKSQNTYTWSKPNVFIIGDDIPARTGHTAVNGGNRVIFVFGGRDSNGSLLNSIAVLDTSTWEWTAPPVTGASPEPREAHAATRMGTMMVISGGCDYDNQECFNDLHIFDMIKLEWQSHVDPIGRSPLPRGSHTLTGIHGHILLTAGCHLATDCFNNVWEVTPPQHKRKEWACGGDGKCSKHGICRNYVCLCDEGYTGSDCGDVSNNKGFLCSSSSLSSSSSSSHSDSSPPCSGHGLCMEDGLCVCSLGWRGPLCSNKVNQELCDHCNNSNGVCVGYGHQCHCFKGWAGSNCELCQVSLDDYSNDDNNNLMDACTGHGICTLMERDAIEEETLRGSNSKNNSKKNKKNSWETGVCECVGGWDGQRCQVDVEIGETTPSTTTVTTTTVTTTTVTTTPTTVATTVGTENSTTSNITPSGLFGIFGTNNNTHDNNQPPDSPVTTAQNTTSLNENPSNITLSGRATEKEIWNQNSNDTRAKQLASANRTSSNNNNNTTNNDSDGDDIHHHNTTIIDNVPSNSGSDVDSSEMNNTSTILTPSNTDNNADGTPNNPEFKRSNVEIKSELVSISKCPNDCSGNGVCVQKKCECYDGFGGKECNHVTNAVIGALYKVLRTFYLWVSLLSCIGLVFYISYRYYK